LLCRAARQSKTEAERLLAQARQRDAAQRAAQPALTAA
jgi:hypothetical protein